MIKPVDSTGFDFDPRRRSTAWPTARKPTDPDSKAAFEAALERAQAKLTEEQHREKPDPDKAKDHPQGPTFRHSLR